MYNSKEVMCVTEKESKPKEEPEREEQPSYQTQPYVGQPSYPTQTYAGQYYNYSYKKLYRSTRDKWIAGVCGGIAEYFNKDPVIIRLLWIVLTIFSVGVGVIAYLAFWILVDKYPSYYPLPVQHPHQGRPRAVHYHYYYRSPP